MQLPHQEEGLLQLGVVLRLAGRPSLVLGRGLIRRNMRRGSRWWLSRGFRRNRSRAPIAISRMLRAGGAMWWGRMHWGIRIMYRRMGMCRNLGEEGRGVLAERQLLEAL